MDAQLSLAISTCVDQVLSSDDNDLQMENLAKLIRELCQWNYPVDNKPNLWHKRYNYVNYLSVKKLLPIWYDYYPNDTSPEKLLTVSLDCLSRSLDDLEDLIQEHDERYNDLYVGDNVVNWIYYDSLETVRIASAILNCPKEVQPMIYDTDINNSEIEFEDWLIPYCASVTFAGGPTWNQGDQTRRKQFWEWWLDYVPEETCRQIIS